MRSFCFEATWATHKDYPNVISHAWAKELGNVIDGSYKVRDDSVIFNSLIFNKNVFDNVFRRKRLLRLVCLIFKSSLKWV